MVDELCEHMVEELQAGVHARRAPAVQVHADVDVGLGRAACDHGAALGAADGLDDLRPVQLADQQRTRAEVLRQLAVGLPVADDPAGRQVIGAVKVLAEHPRAGLAVGGVLFGH